MRSRALVLLLLSNAALAGGASAQNVPTRTFTKPDAEFSEPFTQISAVRELRDGRVIVSDSRDKTLQIIDLKTGRAEKIGREGSGPGEYTMPLGLTPIGNDSTLLYDPLNSRFMYVLPNGKPGGFYSMADGGAGGGRLVIGGLRGYDSMGRIYFQGSNVRITDQGPEIVDSAALTRLDIRTRKTDTVAYIAVPKANTQASGGGGNVQIRIGAPNPFSPVDEWAALPDGRVAIVHATDYHVTYVAADGKRVAGPAISFDRIRVTDADKKAVMEQQRRNPGVAITRQVGPGGTSTRAETPRNVQIPEPTDWPDDKPPVTRQGVWGAPNGQLWVRRHRAAGDADVPLIDVFDASGRITGRVMLPKGTRIVGFGNGTVYLVRSDEDDLQYLQRYKL